MQQRKQIAVGLEKLRSDPSVLIYDVHSGLASSSAGSHDSSGTGLLYKCTCARKVDGSIITHIYIYTHARQPFRRLLPDFPTLWARDGRGWHRRGQYDGGFGAWGSAGPCLFCLFLSCCSCLGHERHTTHVRPNFVHIHISPPKLDSTPAPWRRWRCRRASRRWPGGWMCRTCWCTARCVVLIIHSV